MQNIGLTQPKVDEFFLGRLFQTTSTPSSRAICFLSKISSSKTGVIQMKQTLPREPETAEFVGPIKKAEVLC